MGVGDAADQSPSPRVIEALTRLVRQDFGEEALDGPPWAAVVGESCDGLPLIGPLPGRPRQVALLGFGIAPTAWGPAAVEAVANGILGLSEGWVPAALRASRFL